MIRRQLTLFVPAPDREPLNSLRRTLDPIQAALISVHTTLCREDEIGNRSSEDLKNLVASWPYGPVCLEYGRPERFDGHGLLLPCERGEDSFHRLRRWILQNDDIRVPKAHLTLAHPRNPRSSGNTDEMPGACPTQLRICFPMVSLIEQENGSAWRILWEVRLSDDTLCRRTTQTLTI